MDEKLDKIFKEINHMLEEMNMTLREREIVVDNLEYGKKAIYNKEMSNGIIIRLVNDGTFSIGGNVSKQQKQEYINDLKKLLNHTIVPYGDEIYPIINAIEKSIEEPDRDKEIKNADSIRFASFEPFELKVPDNSESSESEETSNSPETPENSESSESEETSNSPETPENSESSESEETSNSPETPENSESSESEETSNSPETPEDSGSSESEESEETQESLETPEPPTGKLSIVFDAIKGTYTLYVGKEEIISEKPSKAMNEEMSKKIIKAAANKTGCKEKDLRKYLDTTVYALLSIYDSKYKTDYASEFAKVDVKPLGKKESLPFDLVYRLSKNGRADDLDKKDYKDIVTLANNYKEAGIASIEEVKKKDDVSKEKNSKNRRGIIGSVFHIGAEVISAMINFGFSIKDVLMGKKKFRELFSRQAFKRLDSPKSNKEENGESKKKVEAPYNDQTNTVMRLRIRKIIHDKTQDIDDIEKKKKIRLKTIREMAKDRNIDLKDSEGKLKTYKQLEKEVADLENQRYQENKAAYVLKEELGDKNEPDNKDKADSKKKESGKDDKTH